jgi:hypothetical protein
LQSKGEGSRQGQRVRYPNYMEEVFNKDGKVGNIISSKGPSTFPLIPLKGGHPNHQVNNEISLLEL